MDQQKEQAENAKARNLMLATIEKIFQGIVLELAEIASMQILASPSTIIFRKWLSLANSKAQRSAAASAKQGSIV
jgi:hypothetical protein